MPYLTVYAIVKLQLEQNGETTEQDMIDDVEYNADYRFEHDGSDSKVVDTELLYVGKEKPAEA